MSLGSHFVSFASNTILITLLLRFVYPIAFGALLNVFVIRIPIGSHQFLFCLNLFAELLLLPDNILIDSRGLWLFDGLHLEFACG